MNNKASCRIKLPAVSWIDIAWVRMLGGIQPRLESLPVWWRMREANCMGCARVLCTQDMAVSSLPNIKPLSKHWIRFSLWAHELFIGENYQQVWKDNLLPSNFFNWPHPSVSHSYLVSTQKSLCVTAIDFRYHVYWHSGCKTPETSFFAELQCAIAQCKWPKCLPLLQQLHCQLTTLFNSSRLLLIIETVVSSFGEKIVLEYSVLDGL